MPWYEWFTQKLTPATVKTQQTDSPTSALLHSEFEQHFSKGLTPAKLAHIFLQAEQGSLIYQAELFKDMEEKDAHIAAELSKRKMAVKKLQWTLKAPRDASATEKRNTKALETLIRDEIDVASLVLDMLDAIGHGYSCIELGWGRTTQGLWIPKQVEHRSPTWFMCPPTQKDVLHLRDPSALYGVPLQAFGWIPHIHKSRSGYLARTGLHRVLAWTYLYKNYSVRDLAEFLEIYGLPIRIGKYQSSASPEQKRDLLRTVLSIGHNAAGIIPDSMQIELQQVMASGHADSYKVMIDWCERSQSKVILGGTLTSMAQESGNRSLGEVHNEVRLDIRDDDATQIEQSLSRFLVYPVAMLNGLFSDNRCPVWEMDTQEPEDLALLAEALPKLVAAGARIPLWYVNSKLKIPEPEEGEEILQIKNNAHPPSNGAAAMAAAKTTVNVDSDPTPISSETDLLSKAASPYIKDWMELLTEKVNQAESLEALRDDLLASYGDLESEKLENVMSLAFAAVNLSGRFDVQGE